MAMQTIQADFENNKLPKKFGLTYSQADLNQAPVEWPELKYLTLGWLFAALWIV